MFRPKFILVLLWQLLLMAPMAVAQGQLYLDGDDPEQDCGLTLSGKVLDHDTREPLIGATIYIEELQRGTMSDEYGNYHFHHLCRGSYTLKVTYIGYVAERPVLRISTSTVRNLTLHTDARQLKQVVITGGRLQEQAQAIETLQGRELEETRGLSLGESLKKLTGVSSVQTGPTVSKPVIHGLFGNRVVIMNNGVRHESQQWGNEHAPEIDPLNAQQMRVIKGAAGVRYGSDAIGGIVLVEPSALPDSAGINGEVTLIGSTNNRMGTVAAMAEGKLRQLPLSWRLHTSAKKAGSAQAPAYNLNNTGFEEQNMAAMLGYKQQRFGAELYYSYFHTKLGFLSSAHIGNLTDLANAIGRERPEETGSFTYTIARPYQDVSHHLLKAKAFYQTGEAGELQFTYGLQQNVRQEYDRHRNTGDRPQLDLDLQTHTTELVWEHKPVANLSGSMGATTIWQNNSYAANTRPLLPYFINTTIGAFVSEKWRKDNLQLEAGIRYDNKALDIKRWNRTEGVLRPSYTFHNFSGSFGALYDLGYHVTLSANVGYASRAPHAYELFANGLHNSAASFERGNPELVSEDAVNTVATLNYHSNLRLNGELSLYYNTINNYIYLQLAPDYALGIGGAYLQADYMQADARFWGADLNFDYALTNRLTLNNKTSLVYAKNRETGSYLPFITPGRTDNTLRYSFENKSASRLSDNYLALGGLYVGRQNRSDAQSDPVLAAPDAYFLLHAEAGTNLQFGKQQVELGIVGSNLLNTSYRDYQNRLRYFADEMGRMIMFRIKVPL
ncbi:TonB-dependent receptor [Pontibacter virosus]|uniref:Iron complex outermembrane receptor protein n=1 Tax=Pontibacter virosus TaxID=1765052 RepID=A0A2U1AU95_9BACT|nr:TonB-dependent receptor [Pontibacter virosus]PVY39931.1 iron complex outermembrane receptor protein [Pontibacter virosus]